MKWSGDLEKSFPARHSREPGGLRRDILDELADHLACALEHELEGQEDNDQDAAWGRVLARFGDPDAMARKLWWDQMRETIMREWIQTGVTFVMAVAVVAGLILIMRLVTGVGTANEAMREAMQQVAASNQALANAMAEQRAGNEALLTALSGIQSGGAGKADALALSNIEIVVRRGTPEGPPAPEVKVRMYGSVANGDSLVVVGELDPSGRAIFERLSQGKYIFKLEDPTSGLFAEESVTLFAGKGAGEHIFVAPDITPRQIHVDLGLPPYGRDSELLIGTVVETNWSYGDHRWNSDCEVVIGRDCTRILGRTTADTWHTRTPKEGKRNLDAAVPCILAGDVRVTEQIMLLSPSEESGIWNTQPFVSIGQGSGQFPNHVGSFDLTKTADGRYAGILPDVILNAYSEEARTARNCENVPDENEQKWMQQAARLYMESVVVGSNALPEVRFGELREGTLFAARDSSNSIVSELSPYSVERVGLFALPDPSTSRPTEGRNVELAMFVRDAQKRTMQQIEGGRSGQSQRSLRFNEESDASGNTLLAYAVRGDWRGTMWPAFSAEASAPGATLSMDAKPFWQSESKTIQLQVDSKDCLTIPLPQELFNATDNPVTGVLLRWESASDESAWSLGAIEISEDEYTPRVIVTESITTAAIAEPTEKP